jgi:8-oxo-dGTP pyrophosphatase MutT (NUDIX family)
LALENGVRPARTGIPVEPGHTQGAALGKRTNARTRPSATAFGGVLIDERGRVLLFKPRAQFGGYVSTFPKGRPEAGEAPQVTALREVREETGIEARIDADIPEPSPGAFEGDTTRTAYFLADCPHQELGVVLRAATRGHPGALVALSSPLAASIAKQVAEFSAGNHLPVISLLRRFTVDGGLMSYGPDVPHFYRRLATYVDKILKGAKPADLPVEQPTKFELVINLKAATALGLAIPPSVLARVDEVIQ